MCYNISRQMSLRTYHRVIYPRPFDRTPAFSAMPAADRISCTSPLSLSLSHRTKSARFAAKSPALLWTPSSRLRFPYPLPQTPTQTRRWWLQASWQVGDPACQGAGRTISSQECNAELGYILNTCDTNSVTHKYGGTHINNCVDWSIWINATMPGSQKMSCTLKYVYLCLERDRLLIEKQSPSDFPSCSCSDGVLSAMIVDLDPSGGCSMLYA